MNLAPLRDCRIIGIDGDNGAGKTTLAKEVQAALGGTVVSIDDFLIGNGQPYLSQIEFSRLGDLVRIVSAEPVICEGILLLEVLQRLEVRPDFMIFARCEFEGLYQCGVSSEITDYYRRHSPWRTAQLEITLRVAFDMKPGPSSQCQ